MEGEPALLHESTERFEAAAEDLRIAAQDFEAAACAEGLGCLLGADRDPLP